MGADTLVVVEGLHRRYGGLAALRGVSFEVGGGEILGLLGPNGAGKSTTMDIICGVLAPSAGRVSVAGFDVAARPLQAKRHIGYLPEHPPLRMELTVDEYLRFCARLRRVEPRRVGAAVAEARGRCGLDEHRRRLIGNLSKGFQQRVGIAQAIVHQPAVVILDEPTVGLDPLQMREIRALIGELGRDRAVVLSTHILPDVQAVCDRVQILHRGRLVLNEQVANLENDNASFELRLEHPPSLAALIALPGVEHAETRGPDCFGVRLADGRNPGETLATPATRDGWGLLELRAERRSLESLFVELVCGDGAEVEVD